MGLARRASFAALLLAPLVWTAVAKSSVPLAANGNECLTSNACPPINQQPDGSLMSSMDTFVQEPEENGTQVLNVFRDGLQVNTYFSNKDADGRFRTYGYINQMGTPAPTPEPTPEPMPDPMPHPIWGRSHCTGCWQCQQTVDNARGVTSSIEYRTIGTPGMPPSGPPFLTRAAILQALRTDTDGDGFPDGPVEASGTGTLVDVDSDNRPDAIVLKNSDPSVATMSVGFSNKTVPGSAGSLATQCTTIPDVAYQLITGSLFGAGAKAPCVGNDNQGSLSHDFDNNGVKDTIFPTSPEMSENTTGIYQLMVKRVGQGTVSSAPVGIDCNDQANSVCIAPFNKNNTVTLHAVPNSGWTFNGWSSDDPSTNCNQGAPGQIDLAFSTSCTATFVEGTTPTPTPTPTPGGAPVLVSAGFPDPAVTSWNFQVQHTGGQGALSVHYAQGAAGPSLGSFPMGPSPWTAFVNCALQAASLGHTLAGGKYYAQVVDSTGAASAWKEVAPGPPAAVHPTMCP